MQTLNKLLDYIFLISHQICIYYILTDDLDFTPDKVLISGTVLDTSVEC